MTKINIREAGEHIAHFEQAIKHTQKLAEFMVSSNSKLIALKEEIEKEFSNDHILIFFSHTLSFEFYKTADEISDRNTFFRICEEGYMELFTEDEKIVDFAEKAHETLLKEFY